MEEVKFVQGEEAEEQLELVIRDLRTGEERTIKRDFTVLYSEGDGTVVIGSNNFSGMLNSLEALVDSIVKVVNRMEGQDGMIAHFMVLQRMMKIGEMMRDERDSD